MFEIFGESLCTLLERQKPTARREWLLKLGPGAGYVELLR
jgi:hypothetical protein